MPSPGNKQQDMVCFTLWDAIKTRMTTYINREAKQTEEQSNMKST